MAADDGKRIGLVGLGIDEVEESGESSRDPHADIVRLGAQPVKDGPLQCRSPEGHGGSAALGSSMRTARGEGPSTSQPLPSIARA